MPAPSKPIRLPPKKKPQIKKPKIKLPPPTKPIAPDLYLVFE